MGNIVDRIVERITEVLKVFYKWPAVYTIEVYGYGVDGEEYIYMGVLDVPRGALQRGLVERGINKWYKYGEPVCPDFALMYEGVREISSEEPTELRLIEVAVRHLKTQEVVFTFLGDIEIQHIYEVIPIGETIKVYATKTKDGDVVFTDVSQLRQFVESKLRRA
jgi:hypothetical protein